ncbi:MAG: V-type ATP synthase subunit F [Promethearchaeota archaeon]
MKIISIAGEETNLMLHILGIEGFIIKTNRPHQFQQEYEKIMKDKDIGLILLDEKHLLRNQDYFKKKKLQTYPVIVEIPDMQAPLGAAQFQSLFEQTLGFVGTEYGE